MEESSKGINVEPCVGSAAGSRFLCCPASNEMERRRRVKVAALPLSAAWSNTSDGMRWVLGVDCRSRPYAFSPPLSASLTSERKGLKMRMKEVRQRHADGLPVSVSVGCVMCTRLLSDLFLGYIF